MADQRVIRVFISSPADVRPERGIATRVVARLAREFSYYFRVEAVLWEREPMLASHQFQELITPPRETDIAVVLLWSRLGVPLPDEARWKGPLSGRRVTGTEWEFENALAGYREAREPRRPDLLLYRKRAEVTVRLGDRAAYEEQQRQADLVEDFMRRWFRDSDGVAATASSRSFVNGADLEAMLEEHLRELLRKRLDAADRGEEAATIRWHQGSPYRGLAVFEPEHEPVFFGRTRARNEVRELLARQAGRGSAFVLVMGASGSGKSSLVRAGVLPEVREAGMVGSVALVRYAITRPASAADVMSGLAAALLGETALPELAATPLQYTAEGVARLLIKVPEEAAQPIAQGLSAAGREAGLTDRGEARLLLVVDQLEELFTAEGITAEDRERYVAALSALARSGLVWVIATLRSDFFDRLERLPSLAALADGEAKYLLAAPDGAEIEQIIEQPAREAGLRFETEAKTGRRLDTTIRAAAAQEAGSLPLLEYLLEQLWQRRTTNGQLTFDAYDRLGGLEGAIGRRAEEVLGKQLADVQTALPRVLRALVTIRQGVRGAVTARYARIDQFAAASPERRLVESLLAPDARLLLADGETVRVAHEALLTHWPRARDQIAEDRADLQLRARVEEQAVRWQAEAGGKDRDSLLLATGLPLSEAEDLLDRRRTELDPVLIHYVEASSAAVRNRQRRAARRLRATAAVLALLALGAAIGAWFGFTGQEQAQQQAAIAKEQSERARQQEAEAQRQREQAQQQAAIARTESERARQQEAEARRQEAEAQRQREQSQQQATIARTESERARQQEAEARRQEAEAQRQREQADRDRREADEARKRAESNLEQALKLVDTIMTDTVGQFEHLGMSTRQMKALLDGLEPVLVALERDQSSDALATRRLDLLGRLGDLYMALGDIAAAMKHRRAALDLAFSLAEREPANIAWQRARAAGHAMIGDVLIRQAQLPAAMIAYGEGLNIFGHIAAHDPDDTAAQRGIAAVRERIGDALLGQLNFFGALRAFGQGLEIRERLAQRDSNNLEWQRDLALDLERMGDVLRYMGAGRSALIAYRRSLEIVRRLVKEKPENTSWQRGLSATLQSLGALLEERQDVREAQKAYSESLEIAGKLALSDPANRVWQRDLSARHARVGKFLLSQGDPQGALDAYRRSLRISELIARLDPDNAAWQRDVALRHGDISFAIEALGDRNGAIAAARAGQGIILELLKRQPDHAPLKVEANWFAARLRRLGVE